MCRCHMSTLVSPHLSPHIPLHAYPHTCFYTAERNQVRGSCSRTRQRTCTSPGIRRRTQIWAEPAVVRLDLHAFVRPETAREHGFEPEAAREHGIEPEAASGWAESRLLRRKGAHPGNQCDASGVYRDLRIDIHTDMRLSQPSPAQPPPTHPPTHRPYTVVHLWPRTE